MLLCRQYGGRVRPQTWAQLVKAARGARHGQDSEAARGAEGREAAHLGTCLTGAGKRKPIALHQGIISRII